MARMWWEPGKIYDSNKRMLWSQVLEALWRSMFADYIEKVLGLKPSKIYQYVCIWKMETYFVLWVPIMEHN